MVLFELSEWILIRGSIRIRLPIVYRHLYSTRHPVPISFFAVPNSPGPLNHFTCHAVTFTIADPILDLLDSFGLAQHVHFATHVQGYWIWL